MYRSLLLILFYSVRGLAQDFVFTRIDPVRPGIVNVKWYCQPLISEEGYNVYRKIGKSGQWIKQNTTPIKIGKFQVDQAALKEDPQLKDYVELVRSPQNLQGIAMLTVLIKSFRSDPFSKFLGIRYDEQMQSQGEDSVHYKVTLADAQEKLIGVSAISVTKGYKPNSSPKEITYRTKKNEIAFKWLPETNRYYGVEIYRRDSTAAPFIKITKDPVILSKVKQKDGSEEYGETFFVDRNLSSGRTYEYFLKAIDFFGSESDPSETYRVYLKDQTAPVKVDTIYHSVIGRKVSLNWSKRIRESDLAGFNVYRTTKNDTDYTRVNKQLILPDKLTYADSVPVFSSYMYMVSVVDRDSNETISNPYMVEVADNEPPRKPTGLQLKADSGKIFLKWNKNPEPDVLGYLIYRTINKDNKDGYVKLTPLPLNSVTFEDKLPANTKNVFMYRIVAVDASLNRSSYSEFASAQMPDIFPPEAPFLKNAEVYETDHVLLQWFGNAEPDLSGYHIYRKIYGSPDKPAKVNTNLIHRSMTRYTDRHAEKDVHYTYQICALDSSGNSSLPSNQCNIHIKDQEKEDLRISDFRVDYNPKRNSVNLHWKLLTADSVKGVIVFRKAKDDVSLSPLTALLDINKITDDNVVRDSEYLYELRAYDHKGNSVRSQKIRINTSTEKK